MENRDRTRTYAFLRRTVTLIGFDMEECDIQSSSVILTDVVAGTNVYVPASGNFRISLQ